MGLEWAKYCSTRLCVKCEFTGTWEFVNYGYDCKMNCNHGLITVAPDCVPMGLIKVLCKWETVT